MTRAQEAEENYLVKRELATIKQQSEEASAQLEQAKKTIRQLQQQQQPHAVRRRATVLPAGSMHRLRSWSVQDSSHHNEMWDFFPPNEAEHFKIMWCARTDTRASKHVFHHSSGVSRYTPPPFHFPVGIILPSNKIQAVAEQGFSHFVHGLWVTICFGMHEFKLGHAVLHSSVTIYSLLHSVKRIHECVSSCLTGW